MYPTQRQLSYGASAPAPAPKYGRPVRVSSQDGFSPADRVFLMSRNNNGAITRQGPFFVEQVAGRKYRLSGNDDLVDERDLMAA